MNKKSKNQIQQGDVNITRISSIPREAQEIKSNVLREGEATGHVHRVIGDYKLLQLGEQLFLRVLSGNVKVIHEEHGMIDIDKELIPGEYEITPTYEYDYDLEEIREIKD